MTRHIDNQIRTLRVLLSDKDTFAKLPCRERNPHLEALEGAIGSLLEHKNNAGCMGLIHALRQHPEVLDAVKAELTKRSGNRRAG